MKRTRINHILHFSTADLWVLYKATPSSTHTLVLPACMRMEKMKIHTAKKYKYLIREFSIIFFGVFFGARGLILCWCSIFFKLIIELIKILCFCVYLGVIQKWSQWRNWISSRPLLMSQNLLDKYFSSKYHSALYL